MRTSARYREYPVLPDPPSLSSLLPSSPRLYVYGHMSIELEFAVFGEVKATGEARRAFYRDLTGMDMVNIW